MSDSPEYRVIRASDGVGHVWQDLWSFRELLYFLAWRDIAVRYKQTTIGVAWSVIRPMLTLIIFTVVFGRIAHLPSQGVPYPVLVLTGLLPWTFFSSAVGESSNSLINNQNMVSKVYFPRLMLPAGSVAVAFVDFAIALGLLSLMMLWFHLAPNWRVLALPAFMLLAIIASLGVGLWMSALNVKYRDFRYVVPFVLQLGTYVSPVGFSSSVISPKWQLVYSLNPMVGVIDGFRWSILGSNGRLEAGSLAISAAVGFLLFITGFRYFVITERSFADLI